MNTIFRKIPIEKRLPEKDGHYIVYEVNNYRGIMKYHRERELRNNEWVFYRGEEEIQVIYWLEKIELPQTDIIKSLPEYNEILYNAKVLPEQQFREYWNEIQGNETAITYNCFSILETTLSKMSKYELIKLKSEIAHRIRKLK